MLPTPSTTHVSFDNVYEPSEDSYLFLDTLSSASEAQWLHSRFSSPPTNPHSASEQRHKGNGAPLLVELGPGSGVIIAFLAAHAATIFGTEVLSLSADVNWHACLATRTTVEKALAETTTTAVPQGGTGTTGKRNPDGKRSVYLSSVNGDLGSALRPGSVDILIFNPPYVPTESVPSISTAATTTATTTTNSSHQQEQARSNPTFEESSHLLALSYAGGRDGMEVTNRMLAQLPETLSPRGVAYVLFCRGNRPEEVKASIRAWEGGTDNNNGLLQGEGEQEGEEQGCGGCRRKEKWHAETVGTSGKTAGWEKLEIVRIWRE